MAFGVRHQSACATRQSAASCSAAVAAVQVSGYRAGHGRSRSGVVGRSVGGGDCVDPLFYPVTAGYLNTPRQERWKQSGCESTKASKPATVAGSCGHSPRYAAKSAFSPWWCIGPGVGERSSH